MGTVLAAIGVFTGTNVDDLIVLTVLFLASRATGRPEPWQIVTGQYLGIAVLVGVSALGALGLAVVPDRWVGLLGLVPIALGVRAFLQHDNERAIATGLGSITLLTIANGADNIAVYTPVFRTVGLAGSLVTIAVFVALVAPLCWAGSWLGSRPRVVRTVEKFGHWLVPATFIVIGLVVLIQSDIIAVWR